MVLLSSFMYFVEIGTWQQAGTELYLSDDDAWWGVGEITFDKGVGQTLANPRARARADSVASPVPHSDSSILILIVTLP